MKQLQSRNYLAKVLDKKAVKVGISADPTDRECKFQTGDPTAELLWSTSNLEYEPFVRWREKELMKRWKHAQYDKKKSRGKEVFSLSDPIVQAEIARLMDGNLLQELAEQWDKDFPNAMLESDILAGGLWVPLVGSHRIKCADGIVRPMKAREEWNIDLGSCKAQSESGGSIGINDRGKICFRMICDKIEAKSDDHAFSWTVDWLCLLNALRIDHRGRLVCDLSLTSESRTGEISTNFIETLSRSQRRW